MKQIFIFLSLLFLLIACQPLAPIDTPTYTAATVTNAPSDSPMPSATLTVEPTATISGPRLAKPAGTFGAGFFSGVFRSPDGKRIFALMNGKELRWYDAKTLQQEGAMVLSDYPFSPNEVIFGSDPNIVAVIGYSTLVIDLKHQKVIASLNSGPEEYLSGLQFSSDTKVLFFHRHETYNHGFVDKVNAWNIQKNQVAHSYWQSENSEAISDPAISPDEKWIVAGYTNLLQIRNVQTEELLQSFKGHSSEITGVAVSKDGSRLASVDIDGVVRLWDSQTGQNLGKFFLKLETQVIKLSFIDDDQQLLATSDDRSQQAIDLETGQVLTIPVPAIDSFVVKLHRDGYSQSNIGYGISALSISPDGKVLAVGSETVLLWDIQTQKLLGVLEHPQSDYLEEIRFDPTGHILVGNTGREILLWNVTETTQPNLAKVLGSASKIWHDGLSFSQDGKRVAFGYGANVEIWDVKTAQLVKTLHLGSHVQSVLNTQFSTDGQFIYVGIDLTYTSSEKQGIQENVQVWNIEKSERVELIDIPSKDIRTMWAMDYPFVVLENGDNYQNQWIEVWNLETKTFKKIDTGYYRSIIYSKSRDLLFTNDDVNTLRGKFYLWKIDTGKLVYRSESTDRDASFYDVDLLETSNFVATDGYQDGIVQLFDISDILEAARQP